MLRISNVHKRYGRVEVLRGLDLELTAGEFVTLLGPSGCGKTTLLRLIAGLEVPDAGEIRLDDEVLAGPSVFRTPQQRNFGMVFQSGHSPMSRPVRSTPGRRPASSTSCSARRALPGPRRSW